MSVERRREPREALALPVHIGGSPAVTRDISLSGMYLKITGEPDLNGTLCFEMLLEEAHMLFTSEGRIVRIEHRDGFTGIAVNLISPRLRVLG